MLACNSDFYIEAVLAYKVLDSDGVDARIGALSCRDQKLRAFI